MSQVDRRLGGTRRYDRCAALGNQRREAFDLLGGPPSVAQLAFQDSLGLLDNLQLIIRELGKPGDRQRRKPGMVVDGVWP